MKLSIRAFFALVILATAMSFQIIKTRLNITVRDDLGNIVAGASVQLFETEDDYNKEQNVAAQAVTGNDGKVSLKDLKDIQYFILVKKDDKDNVGGGERTDKLEANRINRVTVIIQ